MIGVILDIKFNCFFTMESIVIKDPIFLTSKNIRIYFLYLGYICTHSCRCSFNHTLCAQSCTYQNVIFQVFLSLMFVNILLMIYICGDVAFYIQLSYKSSSLSIKSNCVFGLRHGPLFAEKNIMKYY